MSTACFLLGHGLGMRIHSETGGVSKGLLALDTETTILSNLVDACRTSGLDPTVTCRPQDADRMRRTVDAPVRLHTPHGYVVDVASLSQGVQDLIVVDCDIVAAPAGLRWAIQQLLATSCDCAFTVALLPRSDDPRSIRPVQECGAIVALSHDVAVPRTTGLYRFRGRALEEIRAFVAAQAGTFHDLMEAWVQQRRSAELFCLDVAHNVNWPSDLHAARVWWGQTRSTPTPEGGADAEGQELRGA